jgi:hypothetical protein
MTRKLAPEFAQQPGETGPAVAPLPHHGPLTAPWPAGPWGPTTPDASLRISEFFLENRWNALKIRGYKVSAVRPGDAIAALSVGIA